MPISKLELMERLTRILPNQTPDGNASSANQSFPQLATTYFVSPAHELQASAISLADLVQDHPDFLQMRAAAYAAEGDIVLASVAEEIKNFLNDPTVDLEQETERAPRLLDYVYPVV